MFDVPGRIFPDPFDGPGFLDVVPDVEEISIDVPEPTAELKSNAGKIKGPVSTLLASAN